MLNPRTLIHVFPTLLHLNQTPILDYFNIGVTLKRQFCLQRIVTIPSLPMSSRRWIPRDRPTEQWARNEYGFDVSI